MCVIVFLALAIHSAYGTLPGEEVHEAPCHDMLGNCRQMPRTFCTTEKSKAQMKLLCRKTCGYCPKKEKVLIQVPKPKSIAPSTEIFLLYIKNDVKFLKEEIMDIKYRIRDVLSRQKLQLETIGKSKKSTRTELSQVPMKGEELKQEIRYLNEQTERLSTRIQHQNNRFLSLASNFTDQLASSNDEISEKIKSINIDVVSLSGDLRKYKQQIDSLSGLDDDLADFKVDSRGMAEELQRRTVISIDKLTNISQSMAKRFLESQNQFTAVLETQRQGMSVLERKLIEMSSAFHKEQQKTAKLEKKIQTVLERKDSTLNDQQTESVTTKLENITRSLLIQNRKSDMLSEEVKSLSRNMHNITGEQERTRKYMSYQYTYFVRNMEGLISKLKEVDDRSSKDAFNRTQRRFNSPTVQLERISQLSKMVNKTLQELESLKLQIKGPNQNLPPSKQNLEIINEMSLYLTDLQKKMVETRGQLQTLDGEIQFVANTSATGIANIRKSIEDMAYLRNNESITIQDMRSKFDRGILALLGPQTSNSTRFFKPRFDWEANRLTMYGYIAVNHGGEWGTICDDNFDDAEAEVLCRMAGYNGGVYDDGKYKTGEGFIYGKRRLDNRIWVDELRCEGHEEAIQDCRVLSNGWGDHDCDHSEDVGIKCFIA